MDSETTYERTMYYAIVSARLSGKPVYNEVFTKNKEDPENFYKGMEESPFKNPEVVALWPVRGDSSKRIKEYMLANRVFNCLCNKKIKEKELPEKVIRQTGEEGFPKRELQELLSRTQERSAHPL